MKYILLIYGNEKAWQDISENDRNKMFGEYMSFTEDAKKAGKMVAGDPLQPAATATTVRVAKGKPIHKDGPYAETKEQLGGYYILDCKDLDEALTWAAKIPDAAHGFGAIEVRPLMNLPG